MAAMANDRLIHSTPINARQWLTIGFSENQGEMQIELQICYANGNELLPIGYPVKVAMDRIPDVRRAMETAEKAARRFGFIASTKKHDGKARKAGKAASKGRTTSDWRAQARKNR